MNTVATRTATRTVYRPATPTPSVLLDVPQLPGLLRYARRLDY